MADQREGQVACLLAVDGQGRATQQKGVAESFLRLSNADLSQPCHHERQREPLPYVMEVAGPCRPADGPFSGNAEAVLWWNPENSTVRKFPELSQRITCKEITGLGSFLIASNLGSLWGMVEGDHGFYCFVLFLLMKLFLWHQLSFPLFWPWLLLHLLSILYQASCQCLADSHCLCSVLLIGPKIKSQISCIHLLESWDWQWDPILETLKQKNSIARMWVQSLGGLDWILWIRCDN